MKTLIEIIKEIGAQTAADGREDLNRATAGLPLTEGGLMSRLQKRFEQDEALRFFCEHQAVSTGQMLQKWLARGKVPLPHEYAAQFGVMIMVWEEANERFHKQLQGAPKQ